MMQNLKKKIKDRSAKISVIGLGYVGLQVACLLAKVGFKVIGVDLDKKKVDSINKGISPLDTVEKGIGRLVSEAVKKGGLKAAATYQLVKESGVVIICVDTPVDERTRVPTYKSLKAALTSVGENLKEGCLVIVESTIAPGTTTNLVVPFLEKSSKMKVNKDFYVGHCPERLKPNRILLQLENYPRVIGGLTEETGQVMRQLYKTIVKGQLDVVDPLTAEVIKTEENSFGDTLIAQANALALLCQSYGVDVNQVIKSIRKIPGYWGSYLNPGPGVGGHCFPKDPYLKIAQLPKGKGVPEAKKLVSDFVRLTREINDYMPANVAYLLNEALKEAKIEAKKAKVAILGYSYKENTDDSRNSPTQSLTEELKGKIGEIRIQDPFINEFNSNLRETLKGADALVLMASHTPYEKLTFDYLKKTMNRPIIVDGRNFFSRDEAAKKGFIYKGVGNV